MLRRLNLSATVALMIATALSAQEQPRPGRGGPGGPRGFGSSPLMLVRMAEVRQELKTTDEQNEQLDQLMADVQSQMQAQFAGFNQQEFQNLPQEEQQKRREEFRKKMEEVNKSAEAKLGTILKAEQNQRLKELRLQREGIEAFARPEVAQELGLTQEQQGKIRQVMQESRPQPGALGNLQSLSEEDRRKLFEEMRAKREKAQQDILAVLSDEQKAQWAKMKGAEFKFPAFQGGGFGPGPGAGGGERRRPQAK